MFEWNFNFQMGKQSKKKRSSKQAKKLSSKNNENNGIVSKIEHNDPKIRDATLSALAVTIFQNKKIVDTKVVTAVLQRIAIDRDLNAACGAAGCVLNYLNSNNGKLLTTIIEQLVVKCDVLTIVFNHLTKSSDISSSNLLGLVLEILCIIIEQGSEDLVYRKLTNNKNTDSWGILFPLLLRSESHHLEDCCTNAARALHALLDGDNLLDTSLLRNVHINLVCQEIVDKVLSNPSFSPKARLHACGIIVALHLQIQQYNSTTSSLRNIIPSQVLVVLKDQLKYDLSVASNLIRNVQKARLKADEDIEDKNIEQSIEESIKIKNENARDIARRLKEQKKSRKKCKQQENDELRTGIVESHAVANNHNDNDTDMEDSTTGPGCGKDLQEDLRTALKSWEDMAQTLKLTLEIIANMCVTLQNESIDEDSYHSKNSLTSKNELSQQVNDSCVLENALVVFDVLRNQLSTTIINEEGIKLDLMELCGKCAACIGNIISNSPSNENDITIWRSLASALSCQNKNEVMTGDITSAMFNVLQNCAKQIESYDLNILLTTMQNGDTESRQNVAAMLGFLCSTQPHPTEVNDLVCQQLLSTLISSDKYDKNELVVINEVLCAVMDIYGQDMNNVHNKIFDKYDVLAILIRTENAFKENIQIYQKQFMRDCDHSGLDYELLKETSFNLKRFIKYKQKSI